MLRASAHFVALGLAVLPGCGCSDSSGNAGSDGHGGTGTGTGSDTGTGTETMATGGAGGGLPKPDPDGFEGWSPWPHTPEDCVLFVPDDLSTVEPPVFEPCPFMPDGCEMAGAPWAEEYDWGYGGLLSVSVNDDATWIAISRRTVDLYNEILVLQQGSDEVFGAWRYKTEETGCRGGPTFSNGQAVFTLVRKYAYDEPWFFIAPPDEIFSNPGEPIVLDDNVVALGLSYVTDDILLVPEDYHLFATRRVDGTLVWQYAPPEGYTQLNNPVAVGPYVLSNAWRHGKSALMLSNGLTGGMWPLLEDADVSYYEVHADETDAAWIRTSDWQELTVWGSYELWTAPVNQLPELQATKVVDLDLLSVGADRISVGEGWAAVFHGEDDIRLFRLSDGFERRLPKVPGMGWQSGPEHLRILDGIVWMKSHNYGAAGNDVRHIMRFEIEKLPTP